MCGWADVGSCPPWVTSVTWVSLPGGGYLPWVPTVKYKGGLCCGYIGWALLWWRSIGRPGSKLGLFWCPVALPSSLCAGTHCAGACENGAGERQRSMPRVWVRRKSLGSTRHNQLPTLAHDTLPRHGVRHIAQPAHTVLGKIQNTVEQSCAHWWSHGGAHGGALHASGTTSTCARPSLWKNQLLNGTEL